MKKYEIMFIVKPTLEEASIKKAFEEMKKVLTDTKLTYLKKKKWDKEI